MGATIAEKILAKKAGLDSVRPGEIVDADIDLVMCHDITTLPAIEIMAQNGIHRVFDPMRVVVMPDHFVPNKDIKTAEMVKRIREWARAQGIKFYEIGRHGVCHALLPEEGYVRPGMTIICGDSHTCTHGALGAFATGVGSTDIAAALSCGKLWFKVPETMKVVVKGKIPRGVYPKDVILEIIRRIGVSGARYMAIEFSGPVIDSFSVEGRMTVCNMAIEAGAKAGLIAPDPKTIDYVKDRTEETFDTFYPDSNAQYASVVEIDVSKLSPMVAHPNLPSNGKPIEESRGIKIDQAYLGSCTNGRIEDLRVAARVLDGRKVADGVRMIVVPATTEIWKQANREGLIDIFMEAGAAVSMPTCGACLGGYMGILADGEVCVSSTNRNFVGRMGHTGSAVYLASPAVVAYSAVKGEIADPREVL